MGAMFEGTSSLGDVFCLQDEGYDGFAAVENLITFYTSAQFQPTTYRSAYEALLVEKGTLENEAPWTTLTSGGATAYWCKWKSLGERSRALTEQIAAALGVAPPPAPKKGLLDGLFDQLTKAVLLGGALYAAGRWLGKEKR